MGNQEFEYKISSLVKKGKPKIAIGFKKLNDNFNNKKILNIKRGLAFANIKLIVDNDTESYIKTIIPNSYRSIDIITASKPEEKLVEVLVNNEVDGIIDGTFSYRDVYGAYSKYTGEISRIVPSLFLTKKYSFFLCCPGHDQCMCNESKLLTIKLTADFLEKEWGIKPKIAILTAIRKEDYNKKNIDPDNKHFLNKSYENGEWIVNELKNKYDIKIYDVELNTAIRENYNVIVPVNGVVGNQIYKAFELSYGSKFSPRLGLTKRYAGTSRNDENFNEQIKYLTAWINGQRI